MGLREQAKLDARAILEDTSGFAWPVTLISPLGVITSLRGFTTDVGQTIDPETGQAVAGRRASFSVARAALPQLPEAVAEGSRKPWVASFADSQGVVANWKVIDVLPDAAAGVVVLLLEIYQRAIIALGGAPALPSGLQLSGALAVAVSIGGSFSLPSGLQLSGEVPPAIGGLPALPSGLALSGALTPAVAVGGSPALPMLQLSGALTPAVTIGGSPALPMLQLSGALTVDTNPIAAMLDLETATQVSGAWSSIPDLFLANPATQGTAIQRPTVATSANGLPLWDNNGGDDVMLWPVAANNNQTSQWGLGFWLQLDGVAGVLGLASAVSSSPANRYEFFVQNGLLGFDAFTSQFVSRRGALAGAVTAGPWYFITIEYDGTATGDARCTITIDGTPVTLTFSNSSGTPPGSVMPATLIAATGNHTLGARTAAGAQSMNGRYGPKFYVFGPKLAGATEGLLTAAARAAIKAYKQPT
jgi:hypothetical protein